MAAQITATFPDLDFPHRGEFERSAFVQAQENSQDILSGTWNTAATDFKNQANNLSIEVNNKEANVVAKHDIVVAKEALMNPHYDNIDIVAENIDTIGSKIGAVDIHNATSKSTPADNDEFAILDSATTFSLKKLTFANLKATLLSYFDTLYSRKSAIFGIGQTLQNMTSERVLGATYANTTGKPITVLWSGVLTNAHGVYIDGTLTCTQSNTAASVGWFFVFIVPNNSTYSIVGSSTTRWFELR